MTDADLFHRFALVSAVAAGAVTAGVGLLLFAPRTWIGRSLTAVLAVAVMSGLTALLNADSLGWVAGGGVAAAACGILVSSASVRKLVAWCARSLARPRVIGVSALLAAFAVWGYEAWRFDAANEQMMDETMELAEMPPQPTKAVAQAHTDRGATIELGSPCEALGSEQLAALSRHIPTLYAEQRITRTTPSDQSNCHGWVFTGGRFHVGGRFVDNILKDNGYTQVATPSAGDLCVYRGHEKDVTHTAVVRAALPDGSVLVEGKWGRLGVYLHDADKSCYGVDFSFYHTARGSHLLNGIEEVSTVEAASEHP